MRHSSPSYQATRQPVLVIGAFGADYIRKCCHGSGYKYQEIADKTGVPPGTVKSRIFAARKRLQQQFS